MKAFGMSTVVTSLPSCASITEVKNTDSNFTVVLAASSSLVNSLCFLPSAQFLPLIVPSLFCFNSMMDSSTSFLFSGVKLLGKTGLKVSLMCSCSISANAVLLPSSPNILSPSLRLTCCINFAVNCALQYVCLLLSDIFNISFCLFSLPYFVIYFWFLLPLLVVDYHHH